MDGNFNNKNKGVNIYQILVYVLVFAILLLLGWKVTGLNIGGIQMERPTETSINEPLEDDYVGDLITENTVGLSENLNIQVATSTPENPILEENRFSKNKIGTGIFISAYSSDGNSNYDIGAYYKFQRIRFEEAPEGCDISSWFSQLLWVTGNKGAKILLNNELIGELQVDTGNHGYLLKLVINPGDQICIEGENRNGFSIIFGPDTYYNYDSYCFRGFCN